MWWIPYGVNGFVRSNPCKFTIDTGADVTILSARLFRRMGSGDEIEEVRNNETLKGLDGQVIPIIGTVTLPIRWGECLSMQQILVNRSVFE